MESGLSDKSPVRRVNDEARRLDSGLLDTAGDARKHRGAVGPRPRLRRARPEHLLKLCPLFSRATCASSGVSATSVSRSVRKFSKL
jgi:hypothetical protein